jgi:hypothetical protein
MLPAEVANDGLGAYAMPNTWGGYDADLVSGWTLRTTRDADLLTVTLLNQRGQFVEKAEFGDSEYGRLALAAIVAAWSL